MACQYTKEDKEEMIERIQMRQIGTPQDIASTAIYVAPDEASIITGQALVVGSGKLML